MQIGVDQFYIDISHYNPYGEADDGATLWTFSENKKETKISMKFTSEQARAIGMILSADWWTHDFG